MFRGLPAIETKHVAEEANFRPVNKCPFRVKRTNADNLPVYVYHKNNKTLAITVIRKVRGDVEKLKTELEFICRCRIDEKPGGILEIPGNHRRVVKSYLKGIGY